jgi:2-polyprenyl-6-methoxyphenol hydroxylase-like FAD-dependent oxidoreductase
MTLLGDAAHPMYPVGSNGASQAILDAAALAHRLASTETVEEAFAAYDAERRPSTADIVRTNRRGGPEGVIDLVEARARTDSTISMPSRVLPNAKRSCAATPRWPAMAVGTRRENGDCLHGKPMDGTLRFDDNSRAANRNGAN